jgi:hypothetical protein
MNRLPDKRLYKVMSLLLKAMILILSFWYIATRLIRSSASIDPARWEGIASNKLFLLAFILVIANWGLEALKWKILVAPLEKISFKSALMSVLSGVTISIFSPNRIGEFAGRIFFLRKADKGQAIVASVFGSFIQMTVTVAAGFIAYYILQNKYYNFFGDGFTEPWVFPVLAATLLLTALLGIFMYKKRNTVFVRIRNYVKVPGLYNRKTVELVAGISVLRYIVFSLQYFLMLQAFGITAGTTILLCLIALTFFVTSVIPTFALSEIAVRGATASFFFGTISNDASGIVMVSLLLWITNLVIPALIGSLAVWKLRFFNSQV